MADQVIINDEPLTQICDVLRSTIYGSPDRTYIPAHIPIQIRIMPTIGSTYTGNDVTNALLDGSFYGVYNNETITKLRGGAFEGKRVTEVHLPNVTQIGGSTFYNCRDLEVVDMPALRKVGLMAFAGCTSLREIDLSNVWSFTSYHNLEVFKDCTSLYRVKLGNDLTTDSIPQCLFNNCTSLLYIDVPWGEDDARNWGAPWGAPSKTIIRYNCT